MWLCIRACTSLWRAFLQQGLPKKCGLRHTARSSRTKGEIAGEQQIFFVLSWNVLCRNKGTTSLLHQFDGYWRSQYVWFLFRILDCSRHELGLLIDWFVIRQEGGGLAPNARWCATTSLLQNLAAINGGLTLTFLRRKVGQKRLACMLTANGWNIIRSNCRTLFARIVGSYNTEAFWFFKAVQVFQSRDCFHWVSFQLTPGNLQVSSGHVKKFARVNCGTTTRNWLECELTSSN